MRNRLRKALLQKELTLGGWMQIGHPACAEIFAGAGFDWVCVDLEHGAIDIETMTDIFRTLDAYECAPVARLPANDPVWIHRSLDAGAAGLIIPMVNSAREAENALREAKYPPRGIRGFGYCRANMHGVHFEKYVSAANEEIAMIMQIEHADAIANIDAILQVEGVDGVFIGPFDLSGSMGITGQMNHQRMVEALEKFLKACSKRDKAAGMHVVRPSSENIRKAIEEGYTLIALGLDNVFLEEAAKRALEVARGL